jgi:hypothetical protein
MCQLDAQLLEQGPGSPGIVKHGGAYVVNSSFNRITCVIRGQRLGLLAIQRPAAGATVVVQGARRAVGATLTRAALIRR